MTEVSRAQIWQDRFDGLLLVGAALAVVGVALQVAHLSRATDVTGFALSSAAWVIFAVNAAVMLRVVDKRWKWLWSHTFECLVVIVAFPVWPLLLAHLTLLELVPAVTVLEAAKLAKLAEALRVVRRQRGVGVFRGVVAAVILVLALGAVGLMLGS